MDLDIKERTNFAESHLASIQAYYPRVDTRVASIFAISSAQLAIAALNISKLALESRFVLFFAIITVVASFVIHVGLYICTFPKMKGGSITTMFFGHIADMGEAEFSHRYRSLSVEEIHSDISRQIWRSSKILSAKYYWLRVSSIALGIATVFWLLLLGAISIQIGGIPVLK
jgi:hypothetical protein